MQNTLLIGLSRQVALEREMDVIANNIANLNTNAFKADGALFEEYIGPTARDNALTPSDQRVSFVRDRASWMDLSQGAIERTGNPLDVAINGKGFLAVQTPNGERYTRNGALQINDKGELVTSEGYQVLGDGGPITFQSTDHAIMISADGIVSVREGNATTESQRGKLRLVNFANPSQLQKEGSSLFAAPKGVTPDPATKASLVQGAVEKSNVSAVLQMTRMIEVSRNYANVAALLAQQSNMQSNAIDKLADIPA